MTIFLNARSKSFRVASPASCAASRMRLARSSLVNGGVDLRGMFLTLEQNGDKLQKEPEQHKRKSSPEKLRLIGYNNCCRFPFIPQRAWARAEGDVCRSINGSQIQLAGTNRIRFCSRFLDALRCSTWRRDETEVRGCPLE